ncbi:MAG: hypothetical protein KIS92_18520 [Planctomycetota bacterium]|nr:hypothetical protein [Planctomycetota bacterium]
MSVEKNCYEVGPGDNYSRQWALAELQSGDPQRIGRALFYSAIGNSDWKWVQNTCLQFAENKDEHIQEMAVTSLGELARVNQVDLYTVIPVLIQKAKNKSALISGAAQNAIGDLRAFCIPQEYSRKQVLAAVSKDNVVDMVIGIYDMSRRDSDVNFALKTCLDLTRHQHFAVRETALSGIAEIISNHDFVNVVRPVIRKATGDSDAWVREKAQRVIGCIKTFHGIEI